MMGVHECRLLSARSARLFLLACLLQPALRRWAAKTKHVYGHSCTTRTGWAQDAQLVKPQLGRLQGLASGPLGKSLLLLKESRGHCAHCSDWYA